jgi:hypothetical protein
MKSGALNPTLKEGPQESAAPSPAPTASATKPTESPATSFEHPFFTLAEEDRPPLFPPDVTASAALTRSQPIPGTDFDADPTDDAELNRRIDALAEGIDADRAKQAALEQKKKVARRTQQAMSREGVLSARRFDRFAWRRADAAMDLRAQLRSEDRFEEERSDRQYWKQQERADERARIRREEEAARIRREEDAARRRQEAGSAYWRSRNR